MLLVWIPVGPVPACRQPVAASPIPRPTAPYGAGERGRGLRPGVPLAHLSLWASSIAAGHCISGSTRGTAAAHVAGCRYPQICHVISCGYLGLWAPQEPPRGLPNQNVDGALILNQDCSVLETDWRTCGVPSGSVPRFPYEALRAGPCPSPPRPQ